VIVGSSFSERHTSLLSPHRGQVASVFRAMCMIVRSQFAKQIPPRGGGAARRWRVVHVASRQRFDVCRIIRLFSKLDGSIPSLISWVIISDSKLRARANEVAATR
jgi:hypothetical protein